MKLRLSDGMKLRLSDGIKLRLSDGIKLRLSDGIERKTIGRIKTKDFRTESNGVNQIHLKERRSRRVRALFS